MNQAPVLHSALWLIELVCLCLLAAAKNLGKKKSYILAGIVIICELAITASLAIIGIRFDGILSSFAQTVNAVILGIIVYAKYQEKTARGAK